MANRILKHFRFGPTFAKINRTLRSRRKAIRKIMVLYKKFGLVSNGCSLCESNNFTLVVKVIVMVLTLKNIFVMNVA